MFDPRATCCGASAFALLLLVGTAACRDTTPAADALIGPQVSTARQTIRQPAGTSCAPSPTVVVATEPALIAAVAASHPGDVIAIEGTIVIEHEIEVNTAGLTITCAQPGDGLVASPTTPDIYALLDIYAPDVTVQGLSLSARNANNAIYAVVSPGFFDGRRVRVTGNDIQCGWGTCVFIHGSGARITHNTFTSSSSPGSGVHVQSGIDSTLVEGNQFIALVPQGNPRFGAIRTVAGRDVVIRDNVITGPWSNGLALTRLQGGLVEGNSVSGVRLSGLYFAYGLNHTVTVRGLLVRGNTSTSAGAALFVDGACGNVFLANRLATTAASAAAEFALNTGANALLGQHSGGVIDNGDVDCDGDGTVDPNMVSGTKRKGTTPPGEVIGFVMRTVHGIVIE